MSGVLVTFAFLLVNFSYFHHDSAPIAHSRSLSVIGLLYAVSVSVSVCLCLSLARSLSLSLSHTQHTLFHTQHLSHTILHTHNTLPPDMPGSIYRSLMLS